MISAKPSTRQRLLQNRRRRASDGARYVAPWHSRQVAFSNRQRIPLTECDPTFRWFVEFGTIDTSRLAVMGQGFIVITAARAARAGAKFQEIVDSINRDIPRVDFRAAFDTPEYLERGGRIGKAQAFWGSLLKINPIIGMKDDEVFPFGRERSKAKAIDHLYNFAMSHSHIEELAVEYAMALDDAKKLVERLGTKFPKERIHCSRVSPVIGTHTGPGVLVVTVLGDK